MKDGTHIPDQSSKQHSVLPLSSHIQTLPIRARPAKSKQAAYPAVEEVRPRVQQRDKVVKNLGLVSKQPETSELSRVVRRIIFQHGRDCQRSHHVDERSLTKLLGVLAIPDATESNKATTSTTIPPFRPQQLGAQSTTAYTEFGSHPAQAAGSTKQSDKSKGKQREEPPENGSETGRSSDDDQRNRHPRDPGSLFGEVRTDTLRCPFVANPRHPNSKDFERCLVANLTTMDKFVQHLRRTHGYCIRCAGRFPDEKSFKRHKSRSNQCSGCHKVFINDENLNKHKQKHRECSGRDSRDEAEKYRAIWESIVPGIPCPREYRVDHASQFRNYSQIISDLQTLPPECITDILSQLKVALGQRYNMNYTELQARLELTNRYLSPHPTTVYNQNHLAGVPQSASSNEAAPSNDRNDQPESSRRHEASPQYEPDSFDISPEDEALFQSISSAPVNRNAMSEYDFSSHLPHSPTNQTSLPSGPQAPSPYAQSSIQDQLVGSGAHMLTTQPHYSSQVRVQQSLTQPQQNTQAYHGRNRPLQSTMPPQTPPFRSGTFITSTSTVPRSHHGAPLDEVPTPHPSQNNQQPDILRHADVGTTATNQGAYYSHASGQQDRYVDHRSSGATEQGRVPRNPYPISHTSTYMPLQPYSHPTPVSRNDFHFSANSMPGPWTAHQTFPTQQTYDGQQQYQEQSQRPTKRQRHDQYQR